MGHFNTVQMSSTPLSSSGSEGGIGNVLATALSNLAQPVAPLPRGDSWGGLPSPVPFASPKFDIKVQTGVSVCGSRNLVVLGADGKQVGLKRKAAVVSHSLFLFFAIVSVNFPPLFFHLLSEVSDAVCISTSCTELMGS